MLLHQCPLTFIYYSTSSWDGPCLFCSSFLIHFFILSSYILTDFFFFFNIIAYFLSCVALTAELLDEFASPVSIKQDSWVLPISETSCLSVQAVDLADAPVQMNMFGTFNSIKSTAVNLKCSHSAQFDSVGVNSALAILFRTPCLRSTRTLVNRKLDH